MNQYPLSAWPQDDSLRFPGDGLIVWLIGTAGYVASIVALLRCF